MRIVYYNPFINDPWATGVHGRALVEAWRTAGHIVCVAPEAESPGGPATTPRRGRYSRLPQAVRLPVIEVRARAMAALRSRRLLAAVAAFRPDVAVVRRGPYDYLWDVIRPALRVPVVGETNAVLAREFSTLGYEWLPPWEVKRERRHLLALDRCVCVSEVVASHVLAEGVPAGRVVVAHNGVDLRLFQPDTPADGAVNAWRGPFRRVLAYCGTSAFTHDMPTLFAAVAAVARRDDGIGFLFVGPEPRELAARGWRGGDMGGRLMATGRVAHERIPSLLAPADAFWAALRHDYGSPLKLFEYLAMGKPVALAGVGPGPDILAATGAGLVVPSGAGAELADAAMRLIDNADTGSGGPGARGRRYVEDHASWSSVAADMVAGLP